MLLITNKENIIKLFQFCLQLHIRSNCNEISLNVTKELSDETDQNKFNELVIDEDMRVNATVCDV